MAPPKAPIAAAPLPPQVTPPQAAFPTLKLQGIFYSLNKPAAILNGKMVQVNGTVAGARVLDIDRTSVLVEFQNQRRTLSLEPQRK